MVHEIVSLKDEYGLKFGSLECLCLDLPFDKPNPAWKRPAVIVVPGGAYQIVGKREGMPVASAFLARGFQAFVLEYSTIENGGRYPDQLVQLGCAVDYVKKNAERFHVNADEVFVVGFSAGGHLTANLGVEYASVSKYLGREVDAKPAAIGLGYPVITAKTKYCASHENLLKGYSEEERQALLARLNLDEAVTAETAPSFVWTTATDTLVPAENAMLFALACARNGVPYELHVYPSGRHGCGTFDYEVNVGEFPAWQQNRTWVDSCATFFRSFCEEKY